MMPKREIIWTIILFPLLLFVLFTITLLTLRLFINYFEGKTQIETWEIQRIDSLVRRRLVKDVSFPYDIDPWTNIYHAWGNPLLWFWPWGEAPGDGMHFEKNEVVEDGSVWPPDHVDQDRPADEAYSSGSNQPVTLGYTRQRPKLAPQWQRYTAQEDFYRTEQWQNLEGETIGDFGVDVDSIAPVRISRTLKDDNDNDNNSNSDSDDDTPLANVLKKNI